MPFSDSLNDAQKGALLRLALVAPEHRGLDETFRAFADHLLDCCGFEFAALAVVEEDRRYLRLVGSYPISVGPVPAGASFRLAQLGLPGVQEANDGLEFLASELESGAGAGLEAAGCRRGWSIGLRADGDFLGVFSVARAASEPLEASDLEFLRHAAVMLASATHQGRQLLQATRERDRARLLNDIAGLINSGAGIAAIVERLAVELPGCIAIDYLGLFQRAGDSGPFALVAENPILASEAVAPVPEEVLARIDEESGMAEYRPDRVPGAGDRLNAAGMKRGLDVVLHQGAERLGAITVARRAPFAFSEADRSFLRLLGGLLAQAFSSTRRAEVAQLASARARILNELALLLNAGEAVEALFDRLTSLLGRAIDFDYVSVLESTDESHMRIVGALPQLPRQPKLVTTAEIALEDVLAAGTPVVQEAVEQLTAAAAPWLKRQGYRRFASAALHGHGEVLGLLSVARRLDMPFTTEESAFLETVATLLAQSIANRKRLERAETEAARSRILNDLAVLLNAGEPPETFVERISVPLQQVAPFERLALFIVAEPGDAFHVFGSLRGENTEPGALVSFRDAAFNPTRVGPVDHVQYRLADYHGGHNQKIAESGMVLGLTAYLRKDGELLGLLALGRESDTPFSDDQVAFIDLLATLLAQAVANVRQLARKEIEAHRSRVLNRISLLLNSGRPMDDLWPDLQELLHEGVAHDFCSLVTRDAGPSGFRIRRTEELLLDGKPIPFEPAGFATIAARGSHLNQYETATGVLAAPRALSEAGFARAVSVNLHAGSDLQGIFTLARRANTEFSPQEMAFVDVVGTLIAYAEANRQRIAESAGEAEEQRIIADVAAAAAREGNEGELMRAIREPISRIVAHPFVSFGYLEGDFTTFIDQNNLKRAQPVLEFSRRAIDSGQSWSQHYANEVNPEVGAQLRGWGVHAAALTAADSGGAVVGLLFVGSRDAGYGFDERTLRLLRILAQILGPALANARAAAREREEADEQRTVSEVAAAAARETTPGALIQAVLQPLRQLVPRPYLAFGFIEGEELVYPRVDGSFTRWPFDDYARRALAEGQISGPGSRLDRSTELANWGPKALSMTTAVSGGVPTGVLLVASRQEGFEFGERHLRILRLAARIVGPAMENARAAQRARDDAAEQRLLAQIAATAARERSPGVLVEAVRQPLRPVIPRPLIAFGFIEGDELVYPRADGTTARWPMESDDRRALELGQVHGPAGDLDPTTQLGAWGPTVIAKTVAMSGGSVIGILLAASREAEFAFEERHLRFLKLVAQIIGPAMENARAAERTRNDAAEQRILAEVAAAAARESDPDALLAAIAAPVRAIVPGALVAFSHRDGEELVFSARGIGEPVRVPFGEWFEQAEARGQVTLQVTPDELEKHRSSLWSAGQTIITTARSGGTTTGFLSVTSRVPGFQADERQLRQLRLVAQVVGPAMETARAIVATARQEALYSLMFNSLSEGIVLVDSSGNSVFANELGRRIVKAIDPNDSAHSVEDVGNLLPAEIRRGYIRAMNQGVGSRGRAMLALDGEETWLDYEFVPLNDPAMRLLVVAIDVTADVRHEAEQAQHREQIEQASRLAALGELVGGVAHELNNPLTAILGFSEVMAMNDPAGPSEELGIIQKEALRARNIVRDLLFIARPGASERSTVSISDVVDHVGRLRRAECLRAGIAFESTVTGECVAWGNESQLTQVLLNIVTNAEQALAGTPEKAIRITAESDGDTTSLIVADTGSGMDSATQARVFEPFFTTKHGQGTGLGLSTSYSIVKAHGGDLRVESSPGGGSRFIVTLPVRAPEASEAAGVAPIAEPRPARILVVDDEPSLRKVCQRLLKSIGHHCETAATSAAAIALAERDDFDVILCDYRLAGETADDVVAGLLRVAPQLVSRVVIATGATTDSGVVELTQQYGLRLIAKPYGIDELGQLVRAS